MSNDQNSIKELTIIEIKAALYDNYKLIELAKKNIEILKAELELKTT